MSRFYGILAVMGWIWAIIVFVYLYVRLRRMKERQKRGFEVVPDEKHL